MKSDDLRPVIPNMVRCCSGWPSARDKRKSTTTTAPCSRRTYIRSDCVRNCCAAPAPWQGPDRCAECAASGFRPFKRKEGDMNTWSMALAYHVLFEMYHLLHTS